MTQPEWSRGNGDFWEEGARHDMVRAPKGERGSREPIAGINVDAQMTKL